MEAYFDNSATTKALDSVRDIMVKTLTEDFGNPSAKHTKGMEAENYIRASWKKPTSVRLQPILQRP